jgi:hypothetical protein
MDSGLSPAVLTVARNYLVQLDDIFLTSDGTTDNGRYKSEVSGFELLLLDHAGSSVIPIGGPAFNFLRENKGEGVELEIKVTVWLAKTIFDSIKALFNTTNAAGDSFVATFTGDTGIYALNVQPLFRPGIPPIRFGRFANGRIYDVIISLVVDSFIDEEIGAEDGPTPLPPE